MAHQELVFDVAGMHCGSCAGLIDDELEDTAGVLSTKTSADAKTSTVSIDDSVTSADQVAQVISSAGDYTAKLRA